MGKVLRPWMKTTKWYDAHVDEGLRRKIQEFDFIDFSKLLSRNRKQEDEHKLEFINKNGQTYLTPATEKDSVSINSYPRWEQAFRVYSNVITSRFPNKAPELLQYNHTIYTASVAYTWDNVYEYDREFRHHISRHPTRSWAIILQQVWTMILKDRLRGGDNSLFQKGHHPNRQGSGY